MVQFATTRTRSTSDCCQFPSSTIFALLEHACDVIVDKKEQSPFADIAGAKLRTPKNVVDVLSCFRCLPLPSENGFSRSVHPPLHIRRHDVQSTATTSSYTEPPRPSTAVTGASTRSSTDTMPGSRRTKQTRPHRDSDALLYDTI